MWVGRGLCRLRCGEKRWGKQAIGGALGAQRERKGARAVRGAASSAPKLGCAQQPLSQERGAERRGGGGEQKGGGGWQAGWFAGKKTLGVRLARCLSLLCWCRARREEGRGRDPAIQDRLFSEGMSLMNKIGWSKQKGRFSYHHRRGSTPATGIFWHHISESDNGG